VREKVKMEKDDRQITGGKGARTSLYLDESLMQFNNYKHTASKPDDASFMGRVPVSGM
jgi:hypothetical protein